MRRSKNSSAGRQKQQAPEQWQMWNEEEVVKNELGNMSKRQELKSTEQENIRRILQVSKQASRVKTEEELENSPSRKKRGMPERPYSSKVETRM